MHSNFFTTTVYDISSIIPVSSNTVDLVSSPPDPKVALFSDRNDLHIFIHDKLFFGESTHPSSQISAYLTSFRLSDRSQRHLGESVLMYERRSQNGQNLQVFLSTASRFF